MTSVDSDEPVKPSFKLRTPNDVQSVAQQSSNIQATSKALIRLCVSAGWSGPLLVAHTTLLEISCHGSIIFLSLKIVFILADCADPNEMMSLVAYYLGLCCLPNYLFTSIQNVKVLKIL